MEAERRLEQDHARDGQARRGAEDDVARKKQAEEMAKKTLVERVDATNDAKAKLAAHALGGAEVPDPAHADRLVEERIQELSHPATRERMDAFHTRADELGGKDKAALTFSDQAHLAAQRLVQGEHGPPEATATPHQPLLSLAEVQHAIDGIDALDTPAPPKLPIGANWADVSHLAGPVPEHAPPLIDPMTPRPGRVPTSQDARDARSEFKGAMQHDYSGRLGVEKFGQVHHALEIQLMSRYPGAYTQTEINDFAHARGIPRELTGKELERALHAQAHGPTDPATYLDDDPARTKMQLHGSAIRNAWDRHYVDLNAKLKALGLEPGMPGYRDTVRTHIQDAHDEIDWRFGKFFTESRQLEDWSKLSPEAKAKLLPPPGHPPDGGPAQLGAGPPSALGGDSAHPAPHTDGALPHVPGHDGHEHC